MAKDVSMSFKLNDNVSSTVGNMSNAVGEFQQDINALGQEIDAVNNNPISPTVDMYEAGENLNSAIKQMKNAVTPFRTDIDALGNEMTALGKQKVSLQVDTDRAKSDLAMAKKAYIDASKGIGELTEAQAKSNLEAAYTNYEKVTTELSLVSKQARQTESDMLSATDAISKADNRAAKVTGSSSSSSSSSTSALTGSSLMTSGLIDLLGQSAVSLGTTAITSGMDSDTGSVISSILSGAVSGAAIGSLGGLGIGTAVGAAIGGAAGLISGLSQVYENQNEAMSSYVSDLYDSVTQATLDSLSAGSETAASRETTRISFSTLLGGEDKADSFLNDVTDFSASTPFGYDDLTDISKTLLGYGMDVEEIIPDLTAVGDAGAALGMETSDISSVATALGRMESTDKASLEYLNILTERGVGVIDWLAERDNITTGDVYDNISAGDYSGKDTAAFIIEKMNAEYGGSMEAQSQTFEGLTSTLEDMQTALDNAMGDSYNETMKDEMSTQIDYLSGAVGAEYEKANAMIGEGQAITENLQNEYLRQAQTAILTGAAPTLDFNQDGVVDFSQDSLDQLSQWHDAYLEASENYDSATDEQKALYSQTIDSAMGFAQSVADNEYAVSDVADGIVDITNQQIDAIQQNTDALNSWEPAYSTSQNLSEGQKSIFSASETSSTSDASYNDDPEYQSALNAAFPGRSHATGLSYVPYNDYTARLHEGERVLTAQENRNYNKGSGSITIAKIADSVVIREDADIDRLAEAFVTQLKLAQMAGGY